jgi:EAL domain-containing protein (putative c-di-GMP-specific phosphodiesterase class I)
VWQFLQDDLVAQVEKILRETQVEPTAIKLEITESVTMGDAERTIRVVNGLKKLGLRFSIDVLWNWLFIAQLSAALSDGYSEDRSLVCE